MASFATLRGTKLRDPGILPLRDGRMRQVGRLAVSAVSLDEKGEPMNLAQLRYFKKLAEVEHYTQAAEALFITQPALSNSIKQLERELGVPPFEPAGAKNADRRVSFGSSGLVTAMT